MKLAVKERLILLSVLPARGGLADLRIVRDLQGRLSFDEAEQAALGMTQEGGSVHWSNQADPVEIEIGPRAREIIRAALEALDGSEQLTLDHLAVYERFLDEESPGLREVKGGE